MDYLKKYFSESEFNELVNSINLEDEVLYLTSQKNVTEVLDYLKSKNLNLLDVALYKSNVLFDGLDNIKGKLEKNDKIIKLLQDDIANFDLIGL